MQQACIHVGLDAEISNDPAKVAAADGLILPGVGAFGAAIIGDTKQAGQYDGGFDAGLLERFADIDAVNPCTWMR